MVKKRTVPPASARRPAPTPEEIERFAAGAELGTHPPQIKNSSSRPRNFKAIRVPFSESEFNALTELAQITGRSKLSAIRHALAEQLKRERRKVRRATGSEGG